MDDNFQPFRGAIRSLNPNNCADDNERLGACLRHETPKLSISNGTRPAELDLKLNPRLCGVGYWGTGSP